MSLEPQVTFKNINPSDFILDQIRSHLDTLEQAFPGIISCRVVFERPGQPNREGEHFRVDLVVGLLEGVEVAVNRNAPECRREDPKAALREAFEIAESRIAQTLNRRRQAGLHDRPAWTWPDPGDIEKID
jgi:ribosome-associated translation inhibitor RaiA